MTQGTLVPPSPPAAKPTHGLATASLVCGILGLTCCGFFAAVPAVICGHLAFTKIRESAGAYGGDGLAKAGLIMGYIGIAIGVLAIVAWIVLTIMGVTLGSAGYCQPSE